MIDLRAMLLAELEDFVARHRPCRQLTGDGTEPDANGYMLSVACFCAVTFLCWVALEETADKIVMSDCATWITKDHSSTPVPSA